MIKTTLHSTKSWRGNSLVMTAVFLPVLVGMVALAVDTAVLATARAQLKTVADSAALAGAIQLADNARVQGSMSLTTETTNAMSRAQTAGQANTVLGKSAVLLSNSGNSATGDMVVGYFNPATHAWTAPPLSDQRLTNAVLVNAIRASDHTATVPTLFAGWFGFHGTTMTITSVAMAQNYPIAGFKSVNNQSANLLPIVLDQTTFNAMMAGTTQDQYTYNPATKTVTSGPDGITESVLFPVGSGNPGNWGLVNIGTSDNGTSTISAQIQYGITPAQLATFPNSTIQLDTTLTPPSITFSGNPGIKAGIKSAVDAIIGNPVTIPIYDTSGGNGNNAWFHVIAFAAVRVMDSSFQGNPKYVIVQPALVFDPTAIAGKLPATPTWTAGGVVRVTLAQ